MSSPESPSRRMAALSMQQEESAVKDDELEAFRQQWKAEVATRRPGAEASSSKRTAEVHTLVTSPPSPEPTGSVSRSDVGAARTSVKVPISPTKPSRREGKAPLVQSPPQHGRRASIGPSPTSPTSKSIPFPRPQRDRSSAVALYAEAVEAEQSGRLNDALQLYRKAFKADDNVDRLYALSIRHQAPPENQPGKAAGTVKLLEGPTPADIVDPSPPEIEPYAFTRHVQVQPDYEQTRNATSRLTSIIMSRVGVVPEDHEGPYDPAENFKPDEDSPIPLARLPREILEHIFHRLDVASLESFASTCWHARVLTAQTGAWKAMVNRLYRPPMTEVSPNDLVKRHQGEWRTTLIEEERLRMDGCYIAVSHYIRPGAGEHWVAITHLITYHRFLRFYPDGTVISFLTTDHPSDVVPILKRGLRAKGLNLGQWEMIHEVDAKGKKRARVLITGLMEPGGNMKYEFEMELGLRETSRGRWNKLDINSYSSIHVASGEVLGLSLKHQKPFYFSKVRSYSQHL